MELDLSQMDTIQWLRYGYLGAASGVSRQDNFIDTRLPAADGQGRSFFLPLSLPSDAAFLPMAHARTKTARKGET